MLIKTRFFCVVVIVCSVVLLNSCLDSSSSKTNEILTSFDLVKNPSLATFVESPLIDDKRIKEGGTTLLASYSPHQLLTPLKWVQKKHNLLPEFKFSNEKIENDEVVVSIASVSETKVHRYLAWHLSNYRFESGGPIEISCEVRELPKNEESSLEYSDNCVELHVWENPTKNYKEETICWLEDSDDLVFSSTENKVIYTDVELTDNWQKLSVSFLLSSVKGQLALRISLPNAMSGKFQMRNFKIEQLSLIRFFANQWKNLTEKKSGMNSLIRNVNHMGYLRDALILPVGSVIEYSVENLPKDILEIDYAWAITGFSEPVRASLSFVENDKTTLLWSAVSTTQIPDSAGTPPVNESWREEIISTLELGKRKGKIRLVVELLNEEDDSKDESNSKGDSEIDGNAVFLLGKAMFLSKETDSYDLRKPNIIFLSIDSLAPDALSGGCRSNHFTTPNFDKIMKEGATSNVCISSSGMTYLTLPSVLTSRYPQRNGVLHYGDQLIPSLPSIGSVLESNDYDIRQFSTEFVLRAVWIPGRTGFPVTHYRYDKGESEDDFLRYIERDHNRPFFAYLHRDVRYQYFDVGKWDGKEHIWQRKYRQLVTHADGLLGQVMELAERQRETRPTVIVVTSDHGEDIVGAPLIWAHCHVFDSCLKIPFIIHYPDVVLSGHSFDRQTRSIDIAPTLLGLMGLSIPPEFDGDNLSSLFQGQTTNDEVPPALSTFATFQGNYIFAVRKPPWKMIYNPSDEPTLWYPFPGFVYEKEALFNIIDDPLEKKNLAKEFPKVLKDLQSLIQHPDKGSKKNMSSGRVFQNLFRDGYLERRTQSTKVTAPSTTATTSSTFTTH